MAYQPPSQALDRRDTALTELALGVPQVLRGLVATHCVVLGLDHIQQLLIELLLLLLRPHPSQQGIGLLGRRLARLDSTAYPPPTGPAPNWRSR